MRVFRKFRAWLHYNPPHALSGPEWSSFNKEFKEVAPRRYWLQHRFRRHYILPIKWKWEKITDWLRYRTIWRYHVVKTGLKPGYYDLSNIILHSNFNLLKDFVECDQCVYRDEPLTFWQKYIPLYHVIFPYRDAAAGIAHFEWASKLDDPALPSHERCDHQAVSARETLKLYRWWVDIRPKRTEYVIRRYEKINDRDDLDDFIGNIMEIKPDDAEYRYDIEQRDNQRKEWEDEDTEMLIRLIKIRDSLWT